MTLALASQLWYQQLLSSQLSYTPHVRSDSSTLVQLRIEELSVSRASAQASTMHALAKGRWNTGQQASDASNTLRRTQ